MYVPKYDGNIHPDDWINDIKKSLESSRKANDGDHWFFVVSSVDSTISLPTGINNLEELRNVLKEDISFTSFKNINKRKLQSLKYVPERKYGNTLDFISNFRKLCHNADINDIEEQKKYFYQSLPNCDVDNYFLTEFFKRKEKITSMNDLIKEFEEIVMDETNLINNGSIVALKHVATGKYLTSVENLCYTTGSKTQLVFVGSSEPHPNSLWKVKCDKELVTYTNNSISFQHIKSNKFVGLSLCYHSYYNYTYCKSPTTEHTEVSCNSGCSWEFKHSKLENHQGYLKSNDTINLCINKSTNGNNSQEFLRSHDIQFTIGNDTFQEVVCHNGRLGGNDEWCIELIKQA